MNDDVSRYYDANTRGFLRFSPGGRSTSAIHRALRAPGVRTQEEALHYVHNLILRILVAENIVPAGANLREGAAPRIADLGCGVGGSIRWFASRVPGDFAGLTLSTVQANAAEKILESHDETPGRIRVFQGSFTDANTIDTLRGWLGPADAVYMIEAYNHGASAGDTLAMVRRLLRPGGILIIADDLPTETLRNGRNGRLIDRWREEFLRGWHVRTFESEATLREIAESAGYRHVRTIDLSAYVVVDRLRDRLIRVIAGPARLAGLSSQWWDNIRGGNALQRLEKADYMEYKLIAFQIAG